MSKFELPTNELFEKMIKTNMDHTKPLEMKEKKGMDGKKIFPFWTPVTNDGIETYASYDEYLSEKDKKLRSMELGDKTGIVKSASEFKTVGTDSTKETNIDYEDNSIMSIMKKFVKQINGEKDEDNTGIVKPKAEFKTTVKNGDNVKTTTVELATPNIPKMPEQAIKNTTDTVVKIDSNAANPKGDLVGIVKPKAEVTTSVTKSNGVTTTVKQEIGVPIIKMEKGQIIDLNSSAKVTVDSNAATPKGDLVGVVKPKADFKTNINSSTQTDPNITTNPKIKKGDSHALTIETETTTSKTFPSVSDKMNPVLGDKTGAVKPKAEFKTSVTNLKGENTIKIEELATAKMTTAASDSKIDLNVKPHSTTKGNKSDFSKMGMELGDKTGAVKPKSEVKAEPKTIKYNTKK